MKSLKHIGEIQSTGQAVVGPNSIHISGKRYGVIRDEDIRTITKEELMKKLGKYVKKREIKKTLKSKSFQRKVKKQIHSSKKSIYDISLADIFPTCKAGDKFEHPTHGSTTGNNFVISEMESNDGTKHLTAQCFRDEVWFNPIQVLALLNGNLACEDVGTPHHSKRSFEEHPLKQEIIFEAEEYAIKTGLLSKEDIEENLFSYYQKVMESGSALEKKKLLDEISERLIKSFHFFTIYGTIRTDVARFIEGIYSFDGKQILDESVESFLGPHCTTHYAREVSNKIQRKTARKRSEFDNTPKHFVNVNNGILNIQTGDFLPHSPEHLFLFKFPVNYNPKATCPISKKFYLETVGEEQFDLLIECIALCLLNDNRFKKAVLLVGPHDTGKTTFLKQLYALLGEENISGISFQKLCNDRFASSALYGKSANIYDDLSFSKVKDIGPFKNATGDGKLSGEIKHGDNFFFDNGATLIFSCNKIPEIQDKSDDAYYRRWLLLFFENQIPEGKQDMELGRKLTSKEELEGVMFLAIERLKAILRTKRFSTDLTTKDVKRIMFKEASDLVGFAEECLEEDSNSYLTPEQVYNAYCSYYDKNKDKVKHNLLPQRSVTTEIRQYVPYITNGNTDPVVNGKTMKNKRVFRNVKLKSQNNTNTSNSSFEKIKGEKNTIEDNNIQWGLQGDFE